MTTTHPDAAEPAPAGTRRARPHGKEPVGRERILDAAAQLFVEQGYAATTTRQISSSVGIKQPSLYYHFPNKEAMLVELLVATAEPSVLAARDMLADDSRTPIDRLLELIRFDVHLLASGAWNIGSLYLLPETSAPACAAFRELRDELKDTYTALVRKAIDADEASAATDGHRAAALIFSLVEGVILRRNDEPDLSAEDVADDIEQATLLMLGATRPAA
ncbi:TetR/AcrR family transcriptional regulator [Demequina salsinemoris]|uniref:TetR/AcrR family transcriptional regulator n=1 Tax=Demequina salsinemoris TaxID=577470 RepID=UPI0007812AC9|nr:TetR/AcrR family transcriptional regulator [Demequina salsinemoris]